MYKISDKKRIQLSAISVRGFKSIGCKTQRIAIQPLTLIAGANSSGKSSIMQPLLLLKQTLEAQGEPRGALLLDGPNAKFTSAEQILHRFNNQETYTDFMIKLEIGGNSRELIYTKAPGNGFIVKSMTDKAAPASKPLKLNTNMTFLEIEAGLPKHLLKILKDPSKKFSI